MPPIIIRMLWILAMATIIIAPWLSGLHLLFELMSHLIIFYWLLFLLLIPIFLFRQHWPLAAIAAIGLLANTWHLMPLYLTPVNTETRSTSKPIIDTAFAGETANEKTNDSNAITILSVNVQWNNTDYQRLIALINQHQPDIVALQEVDERWLAHLKALRTSYSYHLEWPEESNFGIAIYSNLHNSAATLVHFTPTSTPSILLHATSPSGQPFQLINTHPWPPLGIDTMTSRDDQLAAIGHYVHQHSTLPTIVVGDLNTTPWSATYQDMIKIAKLRNARNSFGMHNSWPSILPVIGIPIDHCLVSHHWSVKNFQSMANIGSDHRPIACTLSLHAP